MIPAVFFLFLLTWVFLCHWPVVSRMPTTWLSCRSLSSPVQPSQCSTAAPEPCTTLRLTTISYTRRLLRPPFIHWTLSVEQPAPPPFLRLQPPPPPLPPRPQASAGTSPHPDFPHRARHDPLSCPVAPSPSPARTWPATCVRSYAMQTSIRTLGPSTRCRFSPLRAEARLPVPSAPSARLDWTEEAVAMRVKTQGRRRSGTGDHVLRSCGPCMNKLRRAISKHTLTGVHTHTRLADVGVPVKKVSLNDTELAVVIGQKVNWSNRWVVQKRPALFVFQSLTYSNRPACLPACQGLGSDNLALLLIMMLSFILRKA